MLNLLPCVRHLVDSRAAIGRRLMPPEISATEQLADNYDVNTISNNFRLERAKVRELRVHLGRADIDGQAETRSQPEDGRALGVLPFGHVLLGHGATDATKEQSVGFLYRCHGSGGEVLAARLPGSTTNEGLLKVESVPEALPNRMQNAHRHGAHFWPDAITTGY
jgi:hypothetical protein